MSPRLTTVAMLLAICCALAACGHGRGIDAAASPGVPGADVRRGKIVFAAQCAACHGAGGTGGPVANSSLARKRRSYAQVYGIVMNPPPIMPKLYPSRMSEDDVRDVSAYVESL